MGTVWDRTAEFLSDNLGTVVPVALLAFFVPLSIQGSFQPAMQGAGFNLMLGLLLVELAFAVLSVWGSLAISAMALDMGGDRTAGRTARDRLLPALGVSVLLLIAACATTLPIPLALMAAGYDMGAIARGEEVPLTPQMAAGIAGYAILLVFVFVWLSAKLAVVTPVIVREKRFLSAIGQSWKLTRGATPKIIGVLVLFAIVALVSILAAKTVFGSIFVLVAGSGGDGVSLSGVLTSIVVAAVQTGFTVLMPAFTAKLYLALTAEAGLRGSASAR